MKTKCSLHKYITNKYDMYVLNAMSIYYKRQEILLNYVACIGILYLCFAKSLL